MTDKPSEPAPIGEALDGLAHASQAAAQVCVGGRWHEVFKTRHADCGRDVLASGKGEGLVLYDRLIVDPLHGPRGDRHRCPGRRSRSEGSQQSHFGGAP